MRRQNLDFEKVILSQAKKKIESNTLKKTLKKLHTLKSFWITPLSKLYIY